MKTTQQTDGARSTPAPPLTHTPAVPMASSTRPQLLPGQRSRALNGCLISLAVSLGICFPAVAGTEQPAGDVIRVTARAANSASSPQISQAVVPAATGGVGPNIELVGGKRAVRGEVLVAFRPGVGRGRADAVRNGLGAVEVEELRQIGVRVWRLPPGLAVAEAVGALSRNPDVRFAEPNVIMTMLEVFPGPNDPSFVNPTGWPFGYQEHLRHDGATTREIHAEEAWAAGCFGQDVVVAVVDTGVDLDHPDLDNNLYRDGTDTVIGGNFVSGNLVTGRGEAQRALAKGGKPGKPASGGKSPEDDNGHGTHVAGIIAAEMDNLSDSLLETPDANEGWDGGVVGIASQAKIMPVKVLDSSGSGSADGVAKGILFAADNNARIINLSLGGSFSQTVSDAIHYAHVEHDVLVIAAAGNSASEAPHYPASDLYALSVAAVDSSDQCAPFSNLGWSVDVAAPGVDVLSSLIDGSGTYTGGYGRMSGTSMACPMAVGVAALIRGAHPDWSAEQVAAQLLASAENVDADNPGLEGKLGTGRVNAYEAVNSVAAPIASVQGLGLNGGTLTALGPSDPIWVKFSHAVDGDAALNIENYHLLRDSTPIALAMASTEYESFPGQSVRLCVQEELLPGNYQFEVDASVVPGGHVHSFAIVPAAIPVLHEVLPLGSLAYRGSVEGSFRPANTQGLGTESEPNDVLDDDANSLPAWYEVSENSYRTVLSGFIDPTNDADYYQLEAVAGDVITVTMNALDPAGGLDCYLELRDASDTVLAYNDDLEISFFNHITDSRISEFVVPAAGTYYVRALSWNSGSSGPYKLVADLTTSSPPSLTTDLPAAVVAMYNLDLDPGQTVTTRLKVGAPASVRLYQGDADVTPAEDHDPSTGVLYQSVGPLGSGSLLICIEPQDPFSTEEYSLDVLLNAGLEEDEDNDLPGQAQPINSCFQALDEAAPGLYRATVVGRLFHSTRVYVETPGTTTDLSGSWDRIDTTSWAINADENPQSPLHRGVVGTLTAKKRNIESDNWQVDLNEGDRLSVKPWGADNGGGTASDLRVSAEFSLGGGSYVIYYGSELRNIPVPSTGHCRINVTCSNVRSVGTYTLTVELVSDKDYRVDTADYYAFSVPSDQTCEFEADPRVNLEAQSAGGDNYLLKVTPNAEGVIEYGLALTLNAAFDQPTGNETPDQAQLLQYGALGHVGGGVVGYFTDFNESTRAPEQAIYRAGLTPMRIADISTFNFSAIQFLILHTQNGPPSESLLDRLSDIETWVRQGGTLIVHDRGVSSSEGVAEPNPLLVGAPATTLLERSFEYGLDLDVIRDDTLVTSGPGGEIDNSTLDGGYYSNHGFAHANTLPAPTVSILSAGPSADRVAAFAYPLDNGFVYYSTIPLDFYLDYYLQGGDADPVVKNFCEVYAPNVLAYARSLGGADREDWYTLGVLEPGDTISLQTRTPADGDGQFENLLDPNLSLFWLDGSALTQVGVTTPALPPDGRNEAITYEVPSGNAGTYYLRVAAENETHGEYILVPPPEP